MLTIYPTQYKPAHSTGLPAIHSLLRDALVLKRSWVRGTTARKGRAAKRLGKAPDQTAAHLYAHSRLSPSR